MSSRKSTLTIAQNKSKAIDQYRMQKPLEDHRLIIIGQENNFSYGMNAHKGMMYILIKS